MMRFTKVNDDIQAALVQFCVEQETMSEFTRMTSVSAEAIRQMKSLNCLQTAE